MEKKKKVGIITRHAIANYGSVLQTYATQKSFEKLGYDSEIINYIRKDEQGKNIAYANLKSNRNKKWNKNIVTRTLYIAMQAPNYEYSYKCFQKFRKELLNETQMFYESIDELKQNLPNDDIYCTGSDQVWTSMGLYQYDETYFLKFVPEGIPCITYASSFGREEINTELDKNLKELLKNYKKILVREDSAVKIIKEKGYKNVEQVLDPTLLLNKEEWNNVASKKKKRKKYILIYQLQKNKLFDNYAKKLAKKLNLQLIRISPSTSGFLKSGKFVYMPNPKEFLNYFKEAELIITDSFHGTVFSLIFEKRFIDILPPKTGTRIKSILHLTGLEDRILKEYSDFTLADKEINYIPVREILEKERKRSLAQLQEVLEEINPPKEAINVGEMLENKCYGCRACEQICPKNAIQMIENEEGFLVPKVDEKKCIKCKLCVLKCPHYNIKNLKTNNNIATYAAKTKNPIEQKQSSSGGIFPVIARYILEQNGVVFGCGLNNNIMAEHIAIYEKEELERLKGSKYVQSNTKNTFKNVKELLEQNKKVLYSGTPCQIAGLKTFLNKEYENLYTIDLVCHGVPSPKLFQKYIKWLEEKEKKHIIEFKFRTKENCSWGLYYKYELDNKRKKYGSANLSPYYKAFLNGDIYREVCYKCQFADVQRTSDITLADYWGIEKQHPEFSDMKGISAVLINTKKGEKLFDDLKDEIIFLKSDIEKVKLKNKNLYQPTNRPKIRNNIYKGIYEKDFNKAINENFHYKAKTSDYIKFYIPKGLKNKLKKLRSRKSG